MKRKKIMILTANFGAGHNSVSRSIKRYIDEENKDYDVIICDFVEASVPELNEPMVKCYEYQTKYLPLVYNAAYYTKKVIDSKYDRTYRIYLSNMEKFLIEENPDLVISVFPHASASVSYVKENSNFDVPLITVITDVVTSNEWIHKNTDMYFVPSEFIKQKLIKKGISPENIKVTGVPVDKSFLNCNIKSFENKKKLLFMGGGRGLFDMSESFFYWLDNFIEKNKDIIDASIITGTNKELYDKLSFKKPLKNISVLGFVDNMPSIIKEHDLLVTKAGGVTLFESIHMNIPVVVKKPNIGQEIANAKFINREDIGIIYSTERELKKIVKAVVNKNVEIDSMVDNIKDFKRELNISSINMYIEELLNKKYKSS